MLCPCHSQLSYSECCEPYHLKKVEPRPSALMRARYSAYALNLFGYIIETTDPESPHFQKETKVWQKEIQVFSQATRFLGLQILQQEERDENEAYVTFKAILFHGSVDLSFKEKSLFQKRQGKWFYVKGLSLEKT